MSGQFAGASSSSHAVDFKFSGVEGFGNVARQAALAGNSVAYLDQGVLGLNAAVQQFAGSNPSQAFQGLVRASASFSKGITDSARKVADAMNLTHTEASKLQTDFQSGKISQEKFAEGLKTVTKVLQTQKTAMGGAKSELTLYRLELMKAVTAQRGIAQAASKRIKGIQNSQQYQAAIAAGNMQDPLVLQLRAEKAALKDAKKAIAAATKIIPMVKQIAGEVSTIVSYGASTAKAIRTRVEADLKAAQMAAKSGTLKGRVRHFAIDPQHVADMQTKARLNILAEDAADQEALRKKIERLQKRAEADRNVKTGSWVGAESWRRVEAARIAASFRKDVSDQVRGASGSDDWRRAEAARIAASFKKERDSRVRAGNRDINQALARGTTAGRADVSTHRFQERTDAQLQHTESLANRVSFTFRRLFGIMAMFTAARKGMQTFTGFLQETIAYSAKMERLEMTLAGVWLNTKKFQDPSGKLLTTVQAFPVALDAARRSMTALLAESVRTAIPVDMLAESMLHTSSILSGQGFSGAQETKIAALMAMAARVRGITDPGQMAEEVSSVLKGSINKKQTKLGAFFMQGGTTESANQEILGAKAKGTEAFITFLEKKLEGITVAAMHATGAFDTLAVAVKETFMRVSQIGGVAFFEQTKGLLQDIGKGMIGKNAEGEAALSPAALGVARTFFSYMAKGVSDIRDVLNSSTSAHAEALAEFFGQISYSVFSIGANLTQGFVTPLMTAVNVSGKLLRVFGGIGDEVKEISKLAGTGLALWLGGSQFMSATRWAGHALGGRERMKKSMAAQLASDAAEEVGLGASLRGARMALRGSGNRPDVKTLEDIARSQQKIVVLQEKQRIAREAIYVMDKETPTGLQAWVLWLGKGLLYAIAFDYAMRFATKAITGHAHGLTDLGAMWDGLTEKVKYYYNFISGASAREKQREIDEESWAESDLEQLASPTGRGSKMPLEERLAAIARVQDILTRKRARGGPQKPGTGLWGFLGRSPEDMKSQAMEMAGQGISGAIAPVDKETETIVQAINRVMREVGTAISTSDFAKDVFNPGAPKGSEVLGAGKAEYGPEKAQFEKFLQNLAEERQLEGDILDLRMESIKALERQGESHEQTERRLKLVVKEEEVKARFENKGLDLQKKQAAEIKNQQLQQEVLKKIELQRGIIAARVRRAWEAVYIAIRAANIEQAKIAFMRKERGISGMEFAAERLGETGRGWESTKIKERADAARRAAEIAQKQAEIENTIGPSKLALQEELLSLQQKDAQQKQLEARSPLERVGIGMQSQLSQESGLLSPDAMTRMQSMADQFKQVVDTMAQYLSDGLADAFVSAFDPTVEMSLKERFYSFVKDVVTTLIREMVRMFIMRMAMLAMETGLNILAPGSGTAIGAASAPGSFLNPVQPRHKGGPIGPKARGFASGGLIGQFDRGRGIHPDDTVPIWADPREWVIQAPAVNRYGQEFMAAVNNMLIDPTTARGLAKAAKAPSVAASIASSPTGMYAGGRVPVMGTSTSSPAGATQGVRAFVVADEQAMDRLVAGGRRTMARYSSTSRR